MTFEYRDSDGAQLLTDAVNASTYYGNEPVVALMTKHPTDDDLPVVYIPLARVEEVIAGIRDTARQAAKQAGIPLEAGQPECGPYGDTGACNGGPCAAHPVAPAAQLRAAAQKLRTAVDAAAHDYAGRPVTSWHPQITRSYGRIRARRADGTSYSLLHGGPSGPGARGPGARTTPAAAQYIALMGPGTGTALADLLDGLAEFASVHQRLAHAHGLTLAEADYDRTVRDALSVGREILGEDETP
ncbi:MULTISPECIES: hypothetical protein [unclassified Streptomyces]|uniref:hypothetical protein n=1 Tax=unclassified Streptomyces TaxID=2593676 RepID=UPI0035DC218B